MYKVTFDKVFCNSFCCQRWPKVKMLRITGFHISSRGCSRGSSSLSTLHCLPTLRGFTACSYRKRKITRSWAFLISSLDRSAKWCYLALNPPKWPSVWFLLLPLVWDAVSGNTGFLLVLMQLTEPGLTILHPQKTQAHQKYVRISFPKGDPSHLETLNIYDTHSAWT